MVMRTTAKTAMKSPDEDNEDADHDDDDNDDVDNAANLQHPDDDKTPPPFQRRPLSVGRRLSSRRPSAASRPTPVMLTPLGSSATDPCHFDASWELRACPLSF